ncbi:MAG: glycosyltransferase family 2 protein [Myxococcales bacterium]|nr:glycosyltransferase family 2 protein [Myxococcales bacterium]
MPTDLDQHERAPRVSIVMPCLNEEGYIEACLRSVFAQDYPKDAIEIFVADGMSMDKTREIVDRLRDEDPRIKVIDNPDRIQAAGLNAAIRASTGDVIIRMDVHAEYAPDYVRRCVEVLAETGADNVGGAQRAKAKTLFQKALCAALESPLGVGGSKYRSADNEGFVDTIFLGAFRRSILERVGLYDARAVTNEDAELNQRVLAAGGRLYLSRRIVVHYYPRDSFRSLARQYFRYGKGRARTMLKQRGLPKSGGAGAFASLRPAIPFLGLSTLATTALVTRTAFAAMAASYALATGAEAVRVGRRAGPLAIPLVWAIFPTLHVSHGAGFAVGLVTYALKPDWSPEAASLSPRDDVKDEAQHDAPAHKGANGVADVRYA